MIHAHLGLVIRIATEFRNSGPSMEDLIQEGNLGLTIAARRFDPTRATRLATYATYWIRACMMEYVVRSHGPVRIGTTRSQRKIFFGLGRARRKPRARRRRPPTRELLAALLGVRARGRRGDDAAPVGPRRVARRARAATTTPRKSATRSPRTAPRPRRWSPASRRRTRARRASSRALKVLDPRERAIIKRAPHAAAAGDAGALGKKFGISRERVRQLELRAKAKLRNYCNGGVIDARRAFSSRAADDVRAAA